MNQNLFEVLETWACYVQKIVEGKEVVNIVYIRERVTRRRSRDRIIIRRLNVSNNVTISLAFEWSL